MNRNIVMLIATVLVAVSCGSNSVGIVPAPSQVQTGYGSFIFSEFTVISVENPEQAVAARNFASLFTESAGFTPEVVIGSDDAQVRFITESGMSEESYRLKVSGNRIDIMASSLPGFFYGLQTLRLVLPSEIESSGRCGLQTVSVPVMTVQDGPRFSYRGLMLDVARFFMPKENLLEVIDCMSMLKLNKLHLHLTDDNGWRIEIKKYPRLTSVGAWRVDREEVPFPGRKNPEPDEKATIGGFYTQDDIREIVAYAAERQIEVIPEIDMPAHSNAALAAYPQFACPTVDKFIGVLPGIGGSNADIIYCAGNDNTLSFVKDILDEVMELFPSEYVHLGGDEAWKTHWKKCPLCQARIAKEKLEDEEALQGWFMCQMNDYIRSKGKTMMGWDEVTNSTIPEDAVIFGWRGLGKAALKAAEQGHKIVMTPAKVTYLIRYQGPQWFEPLTYFGNNTLKDVYDYEPVGEDWKDGYEQLLMGIQGSLWTEFCSSPEDVTYLLFPRLAAVAERAWAAKGYYDWDGFLKSLDNYLSHLEQMGIVYAKSMYNIQHEARPSDQTPDAVRVSLDCIRPDVVIRYTLDGTDPVSTSELYSSPLEFLDADTLKACTFFEDGSQAGKILTLPVVRNLATGKKITGNAEAAAILTNGIRGSLRQSDFEWTAWTGKDVSFTIDLSSPTFVSGMSAGFLTNYCMGVHKPKSIEFEVSSDGKIFTKVAGREFSDNEIFTDGNFTENITLEIEPVEISYIRVNVKSAGKCPSWHIRPGMDSKICIDEITLF